MYIVSLEGTIIKIEGAYSQFMIMLYDEGVFYGVNQVDGVNVVSKVQLYIDLFNYPARGEEAAEIVLRALEKEWGSQKG